MTLPLRNAFPPAVRLTLYSLFFLLTCNVSAASATKPGKRTAALVEKATALEKGRIGFLFMDAQTGRVLAHHDEDKFFTPASNTKLYTTAAALVRLGAGYRFHTSLRTSAMFKPGDTSVPDLVLIGGGDPNLSGRVLPYVRDTPERDPLSALQHLADEVAAKGVQAVTGDIIADDTRYAYDPYPDGWTVDDSQWYYGAPVSALTLNDNSERITVAPTVAGEPPHVSVIPELGHLIVLNYATTVPGAESHLTWTRSGTSNEWLVTGTVGQLAPPQMQDVAVQDSALFAADALRHELQLRGIAILGRIRARHRDLSSVPDPLHTPFAVDTTGTELAAIDSAPLSSAIQVINKTSQNLHAEMLLRELGWNLRHTGTLAAGLDERKSFLAGAGVPDTDYAFVDGSGLGRQGLTTPQSTVALLRYMWQRPERDVWFASLPVGGFDGTLQKRFKGIAGADRVHAKTGSLAHVAALAGYLQTKRGHWIVFCVMLNAQTAHLPEAQSFLDHLCAIFLDS